MVLLNWFNKSCGNLKFQYNVIDINWVDLHSIICIVNMNYAKEKCSYWLNCIDANFLNEFMTNKLFEIAIFFILITFHAFIFVLASKLF
jgi:hypothetical protein